MKKKHIRLIIDIAMTVLLPMLMAYSLIGETLHEVIGTIIFVLFISHHILNRKWYGGLFKGKYNARRTFQTVLNLLLLLFMLLQPISGILMSKHLYIFLPQLPISAQVRSIHMFLAYWGFVLISIHAGTHLTAPLGKLSQNGKPAWITTIIILSSISLYGCYAFVKRNLADYMFIKSAFVFFDYSEPRIYFFLDYIAIMVLFMMIGCLVVQWLSKINIRKKAE